MTPDPVHVVQPEDPHIRLRAIIARLDELQHRFERAQDSLVYSTMTAEIDRNLDAMDLFDPDWLVGLAEVFAARYFAAIDAFDAGKGAAPWKDVFLALRARSSVLEDAVFPMTAHIVHDLPLALLEVGFDVADTRLHLHDFDQVNRVMENAMGRIRRRVTKRYSPGLRFLDKMERRYDVLLSDYGIRMSRAQAWYDALRLRDPAAQNAVRRALEAMPKELIHSVRHPGLSVVGELLAFLRWVASLFRRWHAGSQRAGRQPSG
jgi:Family of unknown function (DUF5995)